jgi:hypothetical protein
MNRADQETLAWALAKSASAFLRPDARAWLCAKIGAGEQEAAITDLLIFYANSNAELSNELAASIRAWIHGYVGSDSEPLLRHLYGRINVSVTAPATDRASQARCQRLSPKLTAKRSELAARARSLRVGITGGHPAIPEHPNTVPPSTAAMAENTCSREQVAK